MDQPSLYDDDIVTWAEQQASTLRALARRPDLSNILDWENVAEEIESVGRSQIRAVEQQLLQTLIHVLKYMSAPRAQSTRSWRVEVIAFHATARRAYAPGMRHRIDWDRIWKTARSRRRRRSRCTTIISSRAYRTGCRSRRTNSSLRPSRWIGRSNAWPRP